MPSGCLGERQIRYSSPEVVAGAEAGTTLGTPGISAGSVANATVAIASATSSRLRPISARTASIRVWTAGWLREAPQRPRAVSVMAKRAK